MLYFISLSLHVRFSEVSLERGWYGVPGNNMKDLVSTINLIPIRGGVEPIKGASLSGSPGMEASISLQRRVGRRGLKHCKNILVHM